LTQKDGNSKKKKKIKKKVLRAKEVKKGKRSRHGRAKVLDKRIVQIEWKDRLAACSHLLILVAKIRPKFINGDDPAYYKIWINIESSGFFTSRKLRTEVTGDVIGFYRERIEDSLIYWILQGAMRVPLSGYFENVIYKDMKYNLRVQIDRK
jgi:hypothetical protein